MKFIETYDYISPTSIKRRGFSDGFAEIVYQYQDLLIIKHPYKIHRTWHSNSTTPTKYQVYKIEEANDQFLRIYAMGKEYNFGKKWKSGIEELIKEIENKFG